MDSLILYLLIFLDDISGALALFAVFRSIFLKRFRKNIILIFLLALLFALNAFVLAPLLSGYLYDYDGFTDIVSTLLLIAAAVVFFPVRDRSGPDPGPAGKINDPRRGNMVSGIIRTVFTVVLVDSTVEMFYSLVSPYLSGGLAAEYIFCIILHLAVFAIIRLFSARAAVNVLPEVFSRVPWWIYALILLFELTCYYKEFGEARSWYNVLYAVSSAAVIMCLLYLFFMIFRLIRQQREIMEQLKMQREYGESVSKGDEELRSFRHDYKNHMLVINSLLSSGRTDEAVRYLSAVSGSVNGSVNLIRSGNFVADALLNNKAVNCERNGISFSFSGRIPGGGIKNEDLCTILANLLDNAAEAAAEFPGDRYVSVTAGVQGCSFHLKIENPTVRKNNRSRFITTKQDKLNHGIGLRNIRRIVDIYDGQLLLEADEGVFTATLMMQLESVG